jgi:hypothetical protein
VGEVILTIQSDSGRHRAQIVKLSDKAFRIDIERFFEGTDAGGVNRGNFWSPLNDWISYTDTLDRAAEIAVENLHNAELGS